MLYGWKVMAAYRWVDGWLIVTCGLTACTTGSARGSTLGNEYGKSLPFTSTTHQRSSKNFELFVHLTQFLLTLTVQVHTHRQRMQYCFIVHTALHNSQWSNYLTPGDRPSPRVTDHHHHHPLAGKRLVLNPATGLRMIWTHLVGYMKPKSIWVHFAPQKHFWWQKITRIHIIKLLYLVD